MGKLTTNSTPDTFRRIPVVNGGTISSFSNTQGMHFGTNNSTCNSVSINTSGISGTITNVTVEASRGSSLVGTLAISVGGTTFYNGNSTTNALTTSNAQYSYTGSGSGEINILWTKTSGKGAYYIKSITVTYTTGSTTPTVATPTFSPVAGTYTETQSVTIDCETAGATIYYTTNGSTPTNESTQYTAAIPISENTTIKAIAYVGNDASNVSTATYTIVQPLTTMDAIFAAATAAGGTATSTVITFNNWVVTGVKNNNAYVTDGTKGFIIYQSNHGFLVGNVLSGTAACSVQLYRGAAELTNLTTTTTGLTVTTDGTVTPVTNVSIADLAGVNTGAVFSYENLTYNGTVLVDANQNTITPYTTFYDYTSSFETNHTYNVTGVYIQYNDAKEIAPRDENDIEEVIGEVATPAFSPVAGTYAETQSVSISCETNGAAIYYTIDGTEPTNASTQYTTAIPVSSTATIKAIAYVGETASTVATAPYHINSQANPYTVAQAINFTPVTG